MRSIELLDEERIDVIESLDLIDEKLRYHREQIEVLDKEYGMLLKTKQDLEKSLATLKGQNNG